MASEKTTYQQTHLYHSHLELNAKLTPFSGFSMPVWYQNLKSEHLAVRTHSGVFDIGHMGVITLSGHTAFDDLQHLSCNDVSKTHEKKMVYTMLLNHDGGIKDDVMLGQWGDDYIMIINAGNREKVINWITDNKQADTHITHYNHSHALMAIQGPQTASLLSSIFPTIDTIKRFGVSLLDHNILAMRTGYTGEDGFELLVPKESATALWQQIIQLEVTPCGLAARDTLRLEKGLPLYGQELTENISPLQTRYPWVIHWEHDFIGKEALLTQKEITTQTTVGIKLLERKIPRTGYAIQEGGHVTSGTLSPSLDDPIALAIINKTHAEIGTTLHVNIREKWIPATIVKVPFL